MTALLKSDGAIKLSASVRLFRSLMFGSEIGAINFGVELTSSLFPDVSEIDATQAYNTIFH